MEYDPNGPSLEQLARHWKEVAEAEIQRGLYHEARVREQQEELDRCAKQQVYACRQVPWPVGRRARGG